MTCLPMPLVHSHYTELVERHEISVEVLPDDLGDPQRVAILADTREAAFEWMADEGLSGMVESFETRDPTHVIGVRFEVVVAKALSTPTGADNQWRWSNRWHEWFEKFAALRRAETLAPNHPIAQKARSAKVYQLRRTVE